MLENKSSGKYGSESGSETKCVNPNLKVLETINNAEVFLDT